MNEKILAGLNWLINEYEATMDNLERRARETRTRAYGGLIRAEKGRLVEKMAKKLIELAWEDLGNDPARLSYKQQRVKIPLREDYLERIKSEEIRDYIKKNIKKFYYPLKTDIHLYIDDEFRVAVECKAYTENAMLKRILVDFTLLKQVFPRISFVLFQLESQLGGDYSTPKPLFGSPSTHTLLSYFDIDLHIITLLEGERQVDKPIHKMEYHKPLHLERLQSALNIFKSLLGNLISPF
jgi:hypothetical protein